MIAGASLKDEGRYFFESVISEHDGAWSWADGQRMLMLSSYEYLGLLGHPHLKRAAIAAVEEFGTGHHGVRLLAGTTTLHCQLESKLADRMHADAAIVYSSDSWRIWRQSPRSSTSIAASLVTSGIMPASWTAAGLGRNFLFSITMTWGRCVISSR